MARGEERKEAIVALLDRANTEGVYAGYAGRLVGQGGLGRSRIALDLHIPNSTGLRAVLVGMAERYDLNMRVTTQGGLPLYVYSPVYDECWIDAADLDLYQRFAKYHALHTPRMMEYRPDQTHACILLPRYFVGDIGTRVAIAKLPYDVAGVGA